MEEHRIVLLVLLEAQRLLPSTHAQRDIRTGLHALRSSSAQPRQPLPRRRIDRVLSRARPVHDPAVGVVQDLVRVREVRVARPGKRTGLPVVDQRPGVVPRFGGSDRHERSARQVRARLQLEAGEERHAGDFDHCLQREVARCVDERELVSTRPGLDRRAADLVLEDAQVSGLVVADLADGGVGGVGEASGREGRGIEALDALLVEGEDYPFGGEQVLEQKVVGAGRGCGCCGEDGTSRVARPGGFDAGVGGVDG